MAEFVEQRIEETIPEIEEMERIGLLGAKEVKKLIQKRRDFHYRLARRSKNKIDFMNYVDFEQKLIELIRIRRKQIGIREKRQQIENAIGLRVMKQLRYMSRIWPSHLDTWRLRISFAQFIGWKHEIGVAFTEQINYHGNQESVWVAWTKWEVEERHNFDKARTILLSKATLYHPNSVLIKRELFRLELLYVESLKNKMKNDNIAGLEEIVAENREKVLNCAVARAVYQDAVSKLPNPELYVQLYQVADKFDFAHPLRDEIYRDLSIKFPDAACVWKLKAQRLTLGLIVVKHEENINSLKEGVGEDSDGKEGVDVKEEETDSGQESDSENENEEIEGEENNEASLESGDNEKDNKNSEEAEGEDIKVKVLLEEQVIKKEEDIVESKATDVVSNPPTEMGSMKKLECVISTFDEAARVIGKSFVKTYISELLPLLYQCWGLEAMTDLIFKKLLMLMEAHTASLSPLCFFVWYKVLCEQSWPTSEMQTVLEEAVTCHPEAAYLQLELVRLIMREETDEARLLKEFGKVLTSMKGDCGLQALLEITIHVTNDTLRTKMFIQAADHEDATMARGMRIQHLKQTGLQKGIKGTRKLYNKLSWKPPFAAKLHAQMVELELSQVEVDAEKVRLVFNNAIQQHGTIHPGLWLAYIQFEKYQGDPLKTGGLFTRAERELEPKHAQIFRELNMTIRDLLEKNEPSSPDHQSKTVLVENVEQNLEEDDDAAVCKPALVSLFKEELMLSHTANKERRQFFLNINTMEKQLDKGKGDAPKEDGSDWEPVLQALIGHKIILSVQQVKVKEAPPKKNKGSTDKMIAPRFKKQYQPTDQLRTEEDKNVKIESEDGIQKILKTSTVLKPEFMQQTHLTPYIIGKKKAKNLRRKELEKTKGPGWYDMKAPELTEEVKRDLEVLQMRSVLDPKKHYKNRDMKVLPKYFQLGRVLDNPVEFYSSRVPKKDRKRSLAEEIIHDEEALRYQKRKYNEIIASKQKTVFRHHSRKKKNSSKKGERKS
ncbi:uncharacterized protein LOC121860610 [Homarus americanus]|uniref:uncharacterized protein LOC121860610 n=1 Tax=Homarus americanus TaxID=6706 RepID=UPI001C4869BA|nr:uncharacterized protein LOC121860610 [Homarus americanus]